MQVGGWNERMIDSCTTDSLEINEYLVKANPHLMVKPSWNRGRTARSTWVTHKHTYTTVVVV